MEKTIARPIPIVAFGTALSAFFALTFVICILGYLIDLIPAVQHDWLAIFLPGFKLLSWGTFFLGLVESIIWGWYVALVFGPIYNFCVSRFA